MCSRTRTADCAPAAAEKGAPKKETHKSESDRLMEARAQKPARDTKTGCKMQAARPNQDDAGPKPTSDRNPQALIPKKRPKTPGNRRGCEKCGLTLNLERTIDAQRAVKSWMFKVKS